MRIYPRSYTDRIPDYLSPSAPLPDQIESETASRIRSQFLLPRDPLPYMTDIIRVMRLIKGKQKYVEVGTFDKGCLAYVSTLLAPTALIVDVDAEPPEGQSAKLLSFVKDTQKLVTVVGDSASLSVLHAVKETVGASGADCIFIDGNHAATYCWADYGNYLDLLTPGGLMFFHDVFWQGAEDCLGVSQAMEWIDRVHPVHVVFMDHPVHRFFPSFTKNQVIWGGVGIIRP